MENFTAPRQYSLFEDLARWTNIQHADIRSDKALMTGFINVVAEKNQKVVDDKKGAITIRNAALLQEYVLDFKQLV